MKSEVYTAKGLWTIKSRGFGIREKFTDLSENQDNDRLIFEYVIRDEKENWGDFTHEMLLEIRESKFRLNKVALLKIYIPTAWV